MSRGISVVRAEDLEYVSTPPTNDVYSAEFDAWCEESLRRHLLSKPLGNEAAVRMYWSQPAAEAGLPLLASIYEEGFHKAPCLSGSELDEVAHELVELKRAWDSLELSGDLRAELDERMSSFERAVQMARIVGGVVMIS